MLPGAQAQEPAQAVAFGDGQVEIVREQLVEQSGHPFPDLGFAEAKRREDLGLGPGDSIAALPHRKKNGRLFRAGRSLLR